jgi:hypothetical protein
VSQTPHDTHQPLDRHFVIFEINFDAFLAAIRDSEVDAGLELERARDSLPIRSVNDRRDA